MENQKNNKRVIALLIVIIVILSVLCVLFATGTISFKSNDVYNNEKNQTVNDNNQTNQDDINNYDAEAIAKEKMPVAISLINQEKNTSVYCGTFEDDDMIVIDTNVEYVKITMDASKKFTTLEQLKDHLKKNLSEELINKHLKTEENSYLERDGKLYCQRAHKGFEWLFIADEDKINENNPITYTISNQQQNSFDVTIEARYGLLGSTERNQLVMINSTITKINNTWLVTKYEQK